MITLTETDGAWVIDVAGSEVSQVVLTVRLGLSLLDGDGDTLEVALGTPIRVHDPGGATTVVDPEVPTGGLGQLAVALRFQRPAHCSVAQSGALSLHFADGLGLDVPPDPEFEAWEIDHPEPPPYKLVGMIGGEVAVWSS